MPKKIDHEERKEHILHTALSVFAREGYSNSNLSLIAEEAGLSRPTIYHYFRDKEDIYYYAVKLITGRMFVHYSAIAWSEENGDEINRLKLIFQDIVKTAKEQDASLLNLASVIISAKKEGADFAAVIQKRTAKLSILFKRLIRQGIAKGVITSVDIEKEAMRLLIIAEMICFHIAFFPAYSEEDTYDVAEKAIESLRKTA